MTPVRMYFSQSSRVMVEPSPSKSAQRRRPSQREDVLAKFAGPQLQQRPASRTAISAQPRQFAPPHRQFCERESRPGCADRAIPMRDPIRRIGRRLGPTEPADTFDLIAVVQIRQFTIDIELRFAGCGNPSPSLFDGGYFENSRRGCLREEPRSAGRVLRDRCAPVLRREFREHERETLFLWSSYRCHRRENDFASRDDRLPQHRHFQPKDRVQPGSFGPRQGQLRRRRETDNRGDRTEKKRNGRVAIGNSTTVNAAVPAPTAICQRRGKEGQWDMHQLGVNAGINDARITNFGSRHFCRDFCRDWQFLSQSRL